MKRFSYCVLLLMVCLHVVEICFAQEFSNLYRKSKFAENRSPKISSSVYQALASIRTNVSPSQHSMLSGKNMWRIDHQGRLQVYVELHDISQRRINKLRNYGAVIEVEDSSQNLLQASIPVERLEEIASLRFVKFVRLPNYGIVNKGSKQTQGDALIKSDKVRQQLGLDGSGVKVGLVSAGMPGYKDSIASGDLPADITSKAFGRGGIEAEGEGAELLEIIHDIAPGAQLFSATCDTSLEFAQAVKWLADNGCKVIFTDLGFLNAGPYDGTSSVSQTAFDIVSRGVSFFVPVGNHAQKHYSGTYSDPNRNFFHNFSPIDERLDITVLPEGTFTVFLQWDDQWGRSSNNYDLLLYDPDIGEIIKTSDDIQDGDDAPTEWLSFTNTKRSDKRLAIAIGNLDGRAAPKEFEMFVVGDVRLEQFVVPEGSVANLADANGVISVGAVDYRTPNVIEDFSSNGPTRDGRLKPDIVAPDGVSTRNFSSFWGTSASTPHAAAAAGLILQADSNLTPTQVADALKSTAVDFGPPGPDNTYGYGLIDAFAAVSSLKPIVGPIKPNPGAWYGTTNQDKPVAFVVSEDSSSVRYFTITVVLDSGRISIEKIFYESQSIKDNKFQIKSEPDSYSGKFTSDNNAAGTWDGPFEVELGGTPPQTVRIPGSGTWSAGPLQKEEIGPLQYLSYTMDDPKFFETNDGDGIAEAGEAIKLMVKIENRDTANDALIVVGTLSTDDSDIFMADSNGYLPDIPAGKSEEMQFVFNISDDATTHEVPFSIKITVGNGKDSWTDSFKVAIVGVGAKEPETFLRIEPESKTVNKDDRFDIAVQVGDVRNLLGFQFNLSFNPEVLEALEVKEGEFLKSDGANTFWSAPKIDNNTGTITGITCARLGLTGVDSTGALATLKFVAKKVGDSPLELKNVKLSDVDAKPIAATISNGKVNVTEGKPWDVNKDGVVDLFDLVIVAKAFGSSPPWGEFNPDVNGDNTVDIFDLVTVIRHFDESSPEAAPSVDIKFPVHSETANVRVGQAHKLPDNNLIQVNIEVDSIADLYGVQFDLAFDPEMLEVVSVSEGSLLKSDNTRTYCRMPQIDNKVGGIYSMTVTRIAESEGISDDGIIATITFKVKDSKLTSKSKIGLKNVKLSNSKGSPIIPMISDKIFSIEQIAIPDKFALLQNYPNPFNPETWIPYQLANAADVTIRIYNIAGQLVRKLDLGRKEAGIYHSQARAAFLDGKNDFGEKVTSGIYYYSIQAGTFSATRKLMILN